MLRHDNCVQVLFILTTMLAMTSNCDVQVHTKLHAKIRSAVTISLSLSLIHTLSVVHLTAESVQMLEYCQINASDIAYAFSSNAQPLQSVSREHGPKKWVSAFPCCILRNWQAKIVHYTQNKLESKRSATVWHTWNSLNLYNFISRSKTVQTKIILG